MEKKSKLILIVDDDPIIVRILESLLQKYNYKTVSAIRGKSGIERAKTDLPDLILLDILIPDINGHDVARILQADSSTKDIPIIFMTVTIDLADDKGDHAIEIDGKLYRAFAKPLHNRKLLSEIRKFINARENKNKIPLKKYEKQ